MLATPPASEPTRDPATIRELRFRTGLSQQEFARAVGISAETYRTWDSGRRRVPAKWLLKAQEVANARLAETRLLTLPTLAKELGVHRRTLEAASRDGRLPVQYSSRSVFGRPLQLASLAAGYQFKFTMFGRSATPVSGTASPPALVEVPANYAPKLLGLRLWLKMTQSELARRIGAANKAVIYQWESEKRKPSPVFWERIELLASQWEAADRRTNAE